MVPTWPPTWAQNPPKIDPRAIQNPSQLASCFRSVFGSIFDRFLVDFRPPKRSKTNQNSIIKSSQQPNNQKVKNLKKTIVFFNVFGFPRGSKIGQKWTRNRFENGLKLRCEKNTQIWPKNGPRWSQNGPKLGPCWAPKSFWARPRAKKNDTENGTGIELEIHTLRESRRDATPNQNGLPRGGWGGYLAKAK